MIFPASVVIGAVLAQLEEPRLVPVLFPANGFVAKLGEPMRLGSFIAPMDQLPTLVRSGVSLFFADTDRLGQPVSTDGPFSWDSFDAQRNAVRAAGAEWSLGVFTTFPEANAKGLDEGTVNAFTLTRSPAWSVWSQERLPWTANRYGAINRRFQKLPVVTVGIYGETGDASYFTGQIPGQYQKRYQTNATVGPWLGELKAKDSWRRRVESSYGSVDSAYRSWQMEPPADGSLGVPLDPTYSYSARLALMDWYRGGISSLASALSDIADNVFKESTILVPVGPPNDQPYLGIDLFRLAENTKGKADALKVTSTGYYDFATNWAMNLAKIRASSYANDMPLWTEAGTVQPEEFEERLFEAICLGSRGHVDAPAAIAQSGDRILELAPELLAGEPRTDVAVLHPTSSQLLNPTQLAPPLTFRGCVELRDYMDFDLLEESAVMQGALRRYRVAVIFEGSVWDARTLTAIKDWVEGGGVLLAYDFGKMADPLGNTAVYQTLFGYATDFKQAPTSDKWIGENTLSYKVDVGGSNDSEFLLGQWGAAADGSRKAGNGSAFRLPFTGKDGAVATLYFAGAAQDIKNLQVTSLGRLVAGVSLEGGLTQISLAVDKSLIRDGTINLQIGGLPPGVQLPIDYVTVTEPEGAEDPKPVAGYYEAEVSVDAIKSWSKHFGKGLTIFYPAKRDQWKGYISVIRSAAFNLGAIDAGRISAPKVDDRRDGVYVADLGERLALFNSNPSPVDRGGVQLPSRRLSFINMGKGYATKVSLAAAFGTDASPVENGLVRVNADTDFTITLKTASAGRYRLCARTLRSGALSAVKFKVNGADAFPVQVPSDLDTYTVGDFDLPEGDSTITLRSEKPFLTHFVVATDRPQVRGFRILSKPNGNPPRVRP